MADDQDRKRDKDQEDRQRVLDQHSEITLVGLGGEATATAMLQLCAELLQAGALDDDAIGRIKDAVAKNLLAARTASRDPEEFDRSTRRRLDGLFPKTDDGNADKNDADGKPGS